MMTKLGFLLLFAAFLIRDHVVGSVPVRCNTSDDCRLGSFCHRAISSCFSCTSICVPAKVQTLERCNREENCRFHRPTVRVSDSTTSQSRVTVSRATRSALPSSQNDGDQSVPRFNRFFVIAAVVVLTVVILPIALGLLIVQRTRRNGERATEAALVQAVQEESQDITSDRLLTNRNQTTAA